MTLHPGDSCVNNWMLKAMAKDAGFLKHKRITNHSVHKFLVQKLRNANIPPTETMAITGHKNGRVRVRISLNPYINPNPTPNTNPNLTITQGYLPYTMPLSL
ncbi:hypothetical protein DPMN_042872 [Dreissena polymorpha]|uniref:Tyr recombinase domain-containing protein n=1 Tax=Dreissena polymorpha TaxID=45954 RepID=A0A9D4D1T4_DREPO|nr:hypothetical protein DPMN_042872 [Dreissena polymorpha]